MNLTPPHPQKSPPGRSAHRALAALHLALFVWMMAIGFQSLSTPGFLTLFVLVAVLVFYMSNAMIRQLRPALAYKGPALVREAALALRATSERG